jgi:hypothetical protein
MSESRARDMAGVVLSKLDVAGGKILQIVRATDTTNRSTTSTSFVDASISVTITPQKNDSIILLIWSVLTQASVSYLSLQITDNSNNAISGAEEVFSGAATVAGDFHFSIVGYSTPATINATTYKGRFRKATSGTASLQNANTTGQMYAIEVSA